MQQFLQKQVLHTFKILGHPKMKSVIFYSPSCTVHFFWRTQKKILKSNIKPHWFLCVIWLDIMAQEPMGYDITDGLPYWFRINKWFDLKVNNYLHFTVFIKQRIILVIKRKMKKTLIKPVELFGLLLQTFLIPFWNLNLLDPIDFYCMYKNILQISSFVFCRKQKIDTSVSK